MKLAEFSIRRPVTLTMAVVCIVVLGLVSLDRLPLARSPSISSSSVNVSASYPSSSPEEVEWKVTLPLEETLSTLENVEQITSSSSSSNASVQVEFKPGTDMDLATLEVRDRLEQAKALLPPDLDRIQLRRWQTDQRPILRASIAWRGEGDRLFDIVRKVVEPRLLRLEGVVNVEVRGMGQKQLIVQLD